MLALVLLVVQNSALVLATKLSYKSGNMYSREIVVLASEILKLVTCLTLETRVIGLSPLRVLSTFKVQYREALLLFVPASLYVVQNFLQLYSIQGLSPVFFVVASQLKIPSSALFGVLLLQRRLTRRELWSILLLQT